ncbi:MAG: glucoamylase family protein [Pyrinomonadaceae bacterium]
MGIESRANCGARLETKRGFSKYRWEGYSEALILYLLALASPSHPIPAESYAAWAATYSWQKLYDIEFLYAGPLFIHQFSHLWVDFRGIQDEFMRAHGIDYFENSRRAAHVQQQYAKHNPKNFAGYGEHSWGITASAGPGPARRRINGIEHRFFDYKARGIPYGPDDGTLSPWAVVASLPFAPEIVLPSIRHLDEAYPEMTSQYGFKCSYNPTFTDKANKGWTSNGYYGLDQGPIMMMIENYCSGFLWRLMTKSPAHPVGLAPRWIHWRLVVALLKEPLTYLYLAKIRFGILHNREL